MILVQVQDSTGHMGLDDAELVVPVRLAEIELRQHGANAGGALSLQIVQHHLIDGFLFHPHGANVQILKDVLLVLDEIKHRLVAEVNGLDHVMLGKLLGSGLDHDHPMGGAGHHQIQIAALNFPEAGVNDKVVSQEANPHGRHGPGKGEARQKGLPWMSR